MFYKVFIVISVAISAFCADHAYASLIKNHELSLGLKGSHKKGEIEIITDAKEIDQLEAEVKNRLLKKHSKQIAKEWSRTGIVAEDKYWIWVRDPVIFPSGYKGTYNRIIWRSALDGPQGVAVIPITKNKQIALNLNYRHATRSWEIEIPRGGCLPNETAADGAKRECMEEIGLEIDNLLLLGDLAPDSGLTSTVTPVFLGEVQSVQVSNPEKSEAILDAIFLSHEDLLNGFLKGFVEVNYQNETIKASCRDPYLAYALLIMQTLPEKKL